MKIRCLAIDDEPLALEKLKSYIEKIPEFQLSGGYESVLEAKEAIESEDIDALFIDINMPDMNGIEFIKTLPSHPITVFTTAHSEYALESYSVKAVDYLLKPYSFIEFQRAADRVKEQYRLLDNSKRGQVPAKDKDIIYIRADYKWVKVELKKIKYIQSMSDYIKIYLHHTATPIVTLSTMAKIKSSLPESFIQIHRSYIVNTSYIKSVGKSSIILATQESLPVGESYKEGLNSFLKGFTLI